MDCITDCRIEVNVLSVVLGERNGVCVGCRGSGRVGLITPKLDVLCSKSCVDGWQHTCSLFHGLAFS